MKRHAIALLCIFLSACAFENEPPPVIETEANARLVLEPVWPNEAGVTRLKDEQTAWRENDCDKKVLPFLDINRQDLLSAEVQAGQELKHRFFYAACVSDPAKPLKGTLIRKILFQGKQIFQSVSKDVEVKPGEWVNVAIIKIPPGAKSGDYNFRLSFSISAITVTKDLAFTIKNAGNRNSGKQTPLTPG